MAGAFLFLMLFLPGFAVAQEQPASPAGGPGVVINEIAWPVESAYAADHGLKMGTVIISEIAWMGSPVDSVEEKQWWRYEWLELYNSTQNLISLESWTIELVRHQMSNRGEEEVYFTIALSGVIGPEGYFLIGASDKIPGVDVNYVNLGGKFMNEGMRVVLKDSLGTIVDEVDPHYLNLSVGVDAREGRSGSLGTESSGRTSEEPSGHSDSEESSDSMSSKSWPAGDNESKRTMERVGGSDPPSSLAGWQTSAQAGGTPRAQNSGGFQEVQYYSDSSSIATFGASKKDPQRSSQESLDFFSGATLSALVLALLSSGAAVLLRRRLLRA